MTTKEVVEVTERFHPALGFRIITDPDPKEDVVIFHPAMGYKMYTLAEADK